MEIDESEMMSKEQSISNDSSDGQQEVQQHSQLVQVQPQPIIVNNLSKTTSRPTKGNRSGKKINSVVLNGDTGNSQHLPPPSLSLHLPVNLGETSAQQTPSSAPPAQQPQLMAHLPTNKIINSKQFAQGKIVSVSKIVTQFNLFYLLQNFMIQFSKKREKSK